MAVPTTLASIARTPNRSAAPIVAFASPKSGERRTAAPGGPGTSVAAADTAINGVELLSRFIAGDNSAFVELFNAHNHRLFSYALKIVSDAQAAEDITQEMWEKILKLRTDPSRVRNPIGLFVTIVRNLSLNYLRSRKRMASMEDFDTIVAAADTRERSEREEIVRLAIDQLPFDYREVLILHTYSGYSLEEIAVMLEKSPEAIWKRASRARARLSVIVMGMLEQERRTTEAVMGTPSVAGTASRGGDR